MWVSSQSYGSLQGMNVSLHSVLKEWSLWFFCSPSDPSVYDEIMQPVLHSGYLYKSSTVHRGTLSRKTREGGVIQNQVIHRELRNLYNQTTPNVSSSCRQTSRSSGVRWIGLCSSTSRIDQLIPACRSALKTSCVWGSVDPTPPTTTTASSTGELLNALSSLMLFKG